MATARPPAANQHSSLDEAKRQAIRILAGGPVLYPEEYALVAREFLGLEEQLEALKKDYDDLRDHRVVLVNSSTTQNDESRPEGRPS